jgi:hypothetical protein
MHITLIDLINIQITLIDMQMNDTNCTKLVCISIKLIWILIRSIKVICILIKIIYISTKGKVIDNADILVYVWRHFRGPNAVAFCCG